MSRSSSSLTVALALIVGEVIRSYFFLGFPWGLVGYIWADTSMALLSAWVGPIGLTSVTFFLTALPFSKINNFKPALTSLIIFLVLLSVTYIKLQISDRPSSTDIVRLVQPNAIQEKKWDPLYSPTYFEILLDLTFRGEKMWGAGKYRPLFCHLKKLTNSFSTFQRENKGWYFPASLILSILKVSSFFHF